MFCREAARLSGASWKNHAPFHLILFIVELYSNEAMRGSYMMQSSISGAYPLGVQQQGPLSDGFTEVCGVFCDA